ncbi:MAG: sodium:proton antiporter, partial [Chromatiaceae bacterium]
LLAAGYMLWVGFDAPGGAFQAGALLGAAGVLLRLAGDPTGGLPGPLVQRWLVGSGVAGFVLVGLGLLLSGRGFLNFPTGAAKWL